MNHLVQHVTKPELRSDNTLHVIGVTSNLERWNSRYRLAREWIDRMRATPCVSLHLVEAAYGDRQHELVEEKEHGLRLRVDTNAWIKENMINVGVRHLLPCDWRYVAWIDTDIEFRNPSWAQETLHQLQHFAVVQPWSHCVDVGHRGAVLDTHVSFGYSDCTGERRRKGTFNPNGYTYGHTGYAWAATRGWWEQVEGLMDFCILGSADHHMALACVGESEKTIHSKMIPSFFRRILEWETRAMRVTHGEVGFVEGRIEHHFHGPKKRRYYKERWKILVDAGFDPDKDLMRDEQGVFKIVGKPALERAIRQYNRSRLEDSIEET
jgi:hypothetical protein